MRYRVANQMQERPEQQRPQRRPGLGAGGRARRDMERDDQAGDASRGAERPRSGENTGMAQEGGGTRSRTGSRSRRV